MTDYKIEKITEQEDIAVTAILYEYNGQKIFKDIYHFPLGTKISAIESFLNDIVKEDKRRSKKTYVD